MSTYFQALGLTLAIELGTALMVGFRDKAALTAVGLVNLCTHPVLNLLMAANGRYGIVGNDLALLGALEAAVVPAEYWLLRDTLGAERRNLLALALLMNFNSFAAGLVLYWG